MYLAVLHSSGLHGPLFGLLASTPWQLVKMFTGLSSFAVSGRPSCGSYIPSLGDYQRVETSSLQTLRQSFMVSWTFWLSPSSVPSSFGDIATLNQPDLAVSYPKEQLAKPKLTIMQFTFAITMIRLIRTTARRPPTEPAQEASISVPLLLRMSKSNLTVGWIRKAESEGLCFFSSMFSNDAAQ